MENFGSKTTFIMASVGSAVGLGNIFRFPALAVKYGGVYIAVYILLLLFVGLPLLLSELAMGRKYSGSVIGCLKKIHPRLSGVGLLCCGNSFIIMTYYCVLFSFVLLAAVFSFRLTGASPDAAAEIFPGYIWHQGFPPYSALFLIAAWGAVILCFGKAERLGKISTAGVIFASVIIGLLALLRGLSSPGSLLAFCRIDLSVLLDIRFWCDAVGQVFFSISVMVGVMPAYGSFLKRQESIALCGTVIALFDLAVSLAATVIYATVDAKGSEGLLACFSVYPKAFSQLFGVFSGPVSFLFYLSIALLCLDSVFSYLKSVSGSIYRRFCTSETLAAVILCIISAFFGFFLLGEGGSRAISVLDGRVTPLITLAVGLCETAVFARLARKNCLITEINLGAKRGFSPFVYKLSVCVITPALLILLILSEIFV